MYPFVFSEENPEGIPKTGFYAKIKSTFRKS